MSQTVPPEPRNERPAPEPMRQTSRPARVSERGVDLDQINSSLRTANNRIGGKAPQVAPPRRRSGFAKGFWGALLVVALLAGLYVMSPAITVAVPQARVVLVPYVAAVNQGRAWLDRQVAALPNGGGAATP
jgi:hypothetical protein